ncbi:Conserved_hypothetical protein [Hexamita inflata]|uniref:Uncharacterized protein n=1 Tax=Hexamita inflata TaxID=28002 RepID=A0AA86V4T8_9EUKA|nr:Conserved hypothetical protein [Hexamita inflata]
MSSQLFKYQNFSDVQINAILSNQNSTVVPFIVYDLLNRLDEIALFGQISYNLENLTQNTNILEVQLGHISYDSQEITLKQYFAQQYCLYMSQQPKEWQNNITVKRLQLYKDIMSYYQLHYFTYSSGPNWREIMQEQLKAQPSGRTGKYRIGAINGKMAITKALVVSNKNLDHQTGVNGFLTVVLNKDFDLGIQEDYTLLDENARFIHGINDSKHIEGVRKILLDFGYLKRVRINITVNDYNDVYETDLSFWDNALERANNDEFTLVVSKDKTVFNNYLSAADFDSSELHQRTVIFNAASRYFFQGQIVVTQFGAMDALLVVYRDVVLNDDETIANYPLSEKELYYLNNDTTTDVNKLNKLFQNLNARDILQTFTIISKFPANYQFIQKFQYLRVECIIMCYIFSIPLIVYILFVVKNNFDQTAVNYQYFEDQCFDIDEKISQSTRLYVKQHENLCTYLYKNTLSKIPESYHHKELNIVRVLNKLAPTRFYVFPDDARTFNFQQIKMVLANIHNPQYIMSHLHHIQLEHENLYVSFQLLISQQQYSLMLNQLKQRKSYLTSKHVQIMGSKQVIYRINQRSFKVPQMRLYMSKEKNGSKIVSTIHSKVASRVISNTLSFDSSISEDFNILDIIQTDLIEREQLTPCQISSVCFVKTLESITLADYIAMSIDLE